MSEIKQEAYQPMTFDAIKIGLASPEKIKRKCEFFWKDFHSF